MGIIALVWVGLGIISDHYLPLKQCDAVMKNSDATWRVKGHLELWILLSHIDDLITNEG